MGDPILESFIATEYISSYSFKADAIHISTRFMVIAKVLQEQTKTPAQIGRSVVIKVTTLRRQCVKALPCVIIYTYNDIVVSL